MSRWIVLLNEKQNEEGISTVDIHLDETIPSDFDINLLVSSSYSSLFTNTMQFGETDFFGDQMSQKTFLGILRSIRSNGWNLLGITAHVLATKEVMKSYYLEFVPNGTIFFDYLPDRFPPSQY
jgi:hypothetical protein